MRAPGTFTAVQGIIVDGSSTGTQTVRSCLLWLTELINTHERLPMYFSAITFLHVAYKVTRNRLTDELLDVLQTTCLQSNNVRRCLNARHSSVMSLSQAAKLMKVIPNNSRSTVQLTEIELSKAYLYRTLRFKDSDSDYIYCLANVYLAVLYYTTGQYQRAIEHCTLVTRSQDHSQCSSHVVEGELLPKIDDEIDTVLGLAVFYQHLQTAALNKQQTQHVSVFTTELFAHYLHIRCLSITTKCRQLTQTSLTDEVQRYVKCFHQLQEILITDLLLLHFVNRTKYRTKHRSPMAVSDESIPMTLHSLDTSELVELLQQYAVEHLTAFLQLGEQDFRCLVPIVITDFEALYAYKCNDYQRCLQQSTDNVRTLMDVGANRVSSVFACPEFIQLMDDDIVSLIGLTVIVDPSCREDARHVHISRLSLSLYLIIQSQMILHHSVTSLAQTLDYVEVARKGFAKIFTLDQLLVKLIEHKILIYVSRQLV